MVVLSAFVPQVSRSMAVCSASSGVLALTTNESYSSYLIMSVRVMRYSGMVLFSGVSGIGQGAGAYAPTPQLIEPRGSQHPCQR